MIFLRRYKRFICNFTKDYTTLETNILNNKTRALHINNVKIYVSIRQSTKQCIQPTSSWKHEYFIANFKRRVNLFYIKGDYYKYLSCLRYNITFKISLYNPIPDLDEMEYILYCRKETEYVTKMTTKLKRMYFSIDYTYHNIQYRAIIADDANATNIHIQHDITNNSLISHLINMCCGINVANIREDADKAINIFTPTKRYFISLNLQEVKN